MAKPKARTGTVETENDWISKDAAAKLLGVSVRQVENRAARGEIEKRTLPKLASERAARVEYSRRDVDAIRAGGGRPPALAAANGAPLNASAVTVRPPALPAGSNPFAGFAAQLAALAGAFPPAGKPWLSLKEASEYSGLPARWLREAARAGKLRASFARFVYPQQDG
jgi:hypothetical protein